MKLFKYIVPCLFLLVNTAQAAPIAAPVNNQPIKNDESFTVSYTLSGANVKKWLRCTVNSNRDKANVSVSWETQDGQKHELPQKSAPFNFKADENLKIKAKESHLVDPTGALLFVSHAGAPTSISCNYKSGK